MHTQVYWVIAQQKYAAAQKAASLEVNRGQVVTISAT